MLLRPCPQPPGGVKHLGDGPVGKVEYLATVVSLFPATYSTKLLVTQVIAAALR